MVDKIEVPKQALLDVVRKFDFDGGVSTEDFVNSFDKLRAAFTKDELLTGKEPEPKYKCIGCMNDWVDGLETCPHCLNTKGQTL